MLGLFWKFLKVVVLELLTVLWITADESSFIHYETPLTLSSVVKLDLDLTSEPLERT